MTLDVAATETVQKQLARWSEELINLSRKNRLLYFPLAQASAMRLIAPDPSEILALLDKNKRPKKADGKDNRKGWYFFEPPTGAKPRKVKGKQAAGKAHDVPPEDAADSDDDDTADADEPHEATEAENSEAALAKAASRSGPTGDAALIDLARLIGNGKRPTLTSSIRDPRLLQQTLRSLNRRARAAFLDRAVWTLYLGVGVLKWIDPDTPKGSAEAFSPLLLIPVELIREGLREPLQLVRTDDGETTINPALSLKLESTFGVTLPTSEQAADMDIETLLDKVALAVDDRKDWSVSRDVVLSTFSFHRQTLYHDLTDNAAQIAEHPIIQSVTTGQPPRDGERFIALKEDALDEEAPAEKLLAILDADASQRQCIVAARDGYSFVIDGPPGTGKSQTISNIIAELVAQGQSVLFVSEKAAALDVVHKRLEAAELGPFCLELHNANTTRRELAERLRDRIATQPKPQRFFLDEDRSRLRQLLELLNGYTHALNEARPPLGQTIHDAIGEVCALQDLPEVAGNTRLVPQLTRDDYDMVLSNARVIANNWEPIALGNAFAWRGLRDHKLDTARRRQLTTDLNLARQSLGSLERLATSVAGDLGLSDGWSQSCEEVRGLIRLLKLLAGKPLIPASWLALDSLHVIEERIREREQQHLRWRALVKNLSEALSDRWAEIDAADALRFSDAQAALQGLPLRMRLQDSLTAADLTAIARFLESSVDTLTQARDDGGDIARVFRLPFDAVPIDRVIALTEVGRFIATTTPPEPGWLDPRLLPTLTHSTNLLRTRVDSLRKVRAELSGLFTEKILDVDLDAIAHRLREAAGSFWLRLGAQYRVDKRALSGCLTTGRVTSKVIDRLDDARAWKRLDGELEHETRERGRVLGDHYFRGEDTDFDELENALDVARRALDVVGLDFSLETQEALRYQISRGGQGDRHVYLIAKRAGDALSDWRTEAIRLLGPQATELARIPLSTAIEWCQRAIEPIRTLAELLARLDRWRGSTAAQSALGKATQLYGWRKEAHDLDTTLSDLRRDDEQLLGSLFRGLDTNWILVNETCRYARQIRNEADEPMTVAAAERMLLLKAEPDELQAGLEAWETKSSTIGDLFDRERRREMVDAFGNGFDRASDLLAELTGTMHLLDQWVAYVEAFNALDYVGLGGIVTACAENKYPGRTVEGLVKRAVLDRWLNDQIARDDRLLPFRERTREHFVERVDRFCELDRLHISLAASDVIARSNDRRSALASDGSPTAQAALNTITRQAERKTRHMPIRELLDKSRAVVQVMTPCFMMSPLTVSQFLPPDFTFDVVIFDEASQVRPADAVNCIYRGRRLIVAGDQKQLPPPTYFERMLEEGDDYVADEPETFESILDLCKSAASFPTLSLRWHYRSQHEHLIAFSNHLFYDDKLVTFPGAIDHGPDVGVHFHHVPHGRYQRGGSRDNPAEAEVVAERVLHHARNHPHLTIGVVAFSEAQADAIEQAIERKRAQHEELETLLMDDRLDGFFVKNLENVQGDERHIIIFSVGYGRDEEGNFPMIFGPLNEAGGERRLNVAITRAQRLVEVVSSITAADFPSRELKPGAEALRDYLDYAQRTTRKLDEWKRDTPSETPSPFEAEVARVIRELGHKVDLRVGAAGFRVDIGVRHPDRDGEFAIGVVCDGPMHHALKVARDRERLRMDVLQRLGWNLYRIWSPAWYRNPDIERQRLAAAIERACGTSD